jgi:uncharacterized membrane protein
MNSFNELRRRTLAKVVSWRIIQTFSHTINGFIVSGSWIIGLNIAGWALVVNSVLFWVHERAWNQWAWARSVSKKIFSEQWRRSISKTVSWRILITISNFIIPLIVTGNLVMSLGFLSLATLVNMLLYWTHERGWDHVKWGKQIAE